LIIVFSTQRIKELIVIAFIFEGDVSKPLGGPHKLMTAFLLISLQLLWQFWSEMFMEFSLQVHGNLPYMLLLVI